MFRKQVNLMTKAGVKTVDGRQITSINFFMLKFDEK